MNPYNIYIEKSKMKSDNQVEKIRDIVVSTQPGYKENMVLKLLIPRKIVPRLRIEKGRVTTLYCNPPLDKVVDGEDFELIYSFGKREIKKNGEWEEVKPEDYIDIEDTTTRPIELEPTESKFDLKKLINEVDE